MILTAKQQKGLEITVARYKAKEPWTCIAGYAGTGKSTLVQFIIAALGLHPDDVSYVAYTGKAAKVLRNKGCPNAMTAHRLLYYSTLKPDGRYVYRPRPILEGGYKLIIVDEISMLPKTMWDLLLGHKIPVIALGDPAQIPPIDKDGDNHVLDEPHIFLDEIMRQAQESEIIRLSMWVREGQPLSSYKAEGKEVLIYKPQELTADMCEWADQIICSTNKTRQTINNQMRANKGFGPEPALGDKIISCHNQWDFISNDENEYPIVNGSIGYLTDYSKEWINYPPIVQKNLPILYSNMTGEDGELYQGMPIDYLALTTGTKALSGVEEYRIKKRFPNVMLPFEFNYGYAITCHRAQGSQWGKVLVFEEGFPYESDEHRRWLYTACTRAENRLVIIQK